MPPADQARAMLDDSDFDSCAWRSPAYDADPELRQADAPQRVEQQHRGRAPAALAQLSLDASFGAEVND